MKRPHTLDFVVLFLIIIIYYSSLELNLKTDFSTTTTTFATKLRLAAAAPLRLDDSNWWQHRIYTLRKIFVVLLLIALFVDHNKNNKNNNSHSTENKESPLDSLRLAY